MKAIDSLIEALRDTVFQKAHIGVGSRILVYTASQNYNVVTKAAGEIAHSILRRNEWVTSGMDESEICLRSGNLLKDLFYAKRIIITIEKKPFPNATGDYLDIHAGSHDRIFYDMDTCHEVIMALGLPLPE